MARRRTVEERYNDNIRKQKKILDEFSEYEYEWAGHLIFWYKAKKMEMPTDEYRACAFFLNREYRNKPGSLTLCYEMSERCYKELPETTNENAFDILCFRFKMYAEVLKKGGFS
jgi:hypothetical protein